MFLNIKCTHVLPLLRLLDESFIVWIVCITNMLCKV